MSENQILNKINQLKSRVKQIILGIQNLKTQLEKAEISLDDFKTDKIRLEEELRGILQQIAQIKEKAQILPEIKPHETIQIYPPKIPASLIPSGSLTEKEDTGKLSKPEIPSLKTAGGSPLKKEGPPEITIIPKETIESTSDIIDKEIRIAKEANELMYFFQTSFVDSVTVADVYLSITLEDHFIFRIDYTNYPQRPIIIVPSTIIELYNTNKGKFFDDLTTYKFWDPNNPRRIYELVTDIETVLINIYGADLNSILEETKKFSEQAQSLEEMVELTETAIINQNFEKATELLYAIIDQAYNIKDFDAAKKYTKRLNEVLKKGYKKSK